MRIASLFILTATLVAPAVFARAHDDADRFGWVFVSIGPTIATSTDELIRFDRWISQGDRALLARFGEDEYLIRDKATLDRVDELVDPIRRLGEKAREIAPPQGASRGDKFGRREWKERLRPYKEKRRELLLGISDDIESLARAAVRRGQAQRLN